MDYKDEVRFLKVLYPIDVTDALRTLTSIENVLHAEYCPTIETVALFTVIAHTWRLILSYQVDVDEAADVAQRFSVMSMPTFIFIKDSEVVERFSGANVQKLSDTVNSFA